MALIQAKCFNSDQIITVYKSKRLFRMMICYLWLNISLLGLGIRLGLIAMCLNTLLRDLVCVNHTTTELEVMMMTKKIYVYTFFVMSNYQ